MYLRANTINMQADAPLWTDRSQFETNPRGVDADGPGLRHPQDRAGKDSSGLVHGIPLSRRGHKVRLKGSPAATACTAQYQAIPACRAGQPAAIPGGCDRT
jgi:hypothetical protein